MAQPIIVARATTEKLRGGWSGFKIHGAAHTAEWPAVSSGMVVKSVNPIAAEFVSYAGVNGPRGGEIAVGSALVALLPLRQSSAVQRVRNLRVDLEGRGEIVDRVIEFAELEVAEAAAVEGVGIVRLSA